MQQNPIPQQHYANPQPMQQPQQQFTQQPNITEPVEVEQKKNHLIGSLGFMVRLLLAGIVLGATLFGIDYLIKSNRMLIPYTSQFEAEYQAVFLANGQVYFGDLQGYQGNYLMLKDIYYFQQAQSEGATNPQQLNAQAQQGDVTLVKLGTEVHGPEDQMQINREYVLYIQDLGRDSQVVSAIEDFQTNGGQQQSTPQQQAAPQPQPSF